jgi:hypothetical protein
LWEYQRQDCQYGCGKEGIQLYLPDFDRQHSLEFGIFYPFRPMIHVSQTLRGEDYSGLLPVLKKSD